MGLRDIFRRKALTASPAVLEGLQNRQITPYPPLGGINYNQSVVSAYQRGLDCTYGWMYRTQPAVRSVVDLIATNAAQLPLKLYERISDTERERREDHPAAQLLADLDGRTPSDAFIRRVFLDYLIYDNAYVLKMTGSSGQRVLIRLMPQHVSVYGGRFSPEGYVIWRPDGTGLRVDPEFVMHWFGYDPDDPLKGLSKLDTLRLELAQDQAMQETMVQLAKHGLRGGYIWRPGEAPEWSQTDAARFAEKWNADKQRVDGREPILDEGMEYRQVGVTPKDAEVVPSREFTKQEVADAFGLPMKALMDGDADARKALYADVLPPFTKGLACQLDVSLLREEFDETEFYFEFDLNEKLRGDLEARWQAMTSSAGAPWITRNEIRAKENLPPIEGGDELVTPANVIVGDNPKPAPNVMPIQDPNGPPQDGSYRENAIETNSEEQKALTNGSGDIAVVLLRLFTRQEASFKGRRSFDRQRFTNELTADLSKSLGVEPEDVRDCADALHEGIEANLKANPDNYREVFETARQRTPEIAKVIHGAANKALVDPPHPAMANPIRLERLTQLRGLGLPVEIIWELAGFSSEEVDRMMAMRHTSDLLAETDAGDRPKS